MALSKIQSGLLDSQTNLALTTPNITTGLYLGGSGASNLLEDYEEGTFDIRITVGGTLATDAVTCQYTKVGQLVHIDFQMNICMFLYRSHLPQCRNLILG